jgi:hypothetical protein
MRCPPKPPSEHIMNIATVLVKVAMAGRRLWGAAVSTP